MNTKHTPGNWRIEAWQYNNRNVLTIQTNKDAIAQVLDLWCPDDRLERDANARLIAKAPELRAELDRFMTYYSGEKTAHLGNGEALQHWLRSRALLAEIDGSAT